MPRYRLSTDLLVALTLAAWLGLPGLGRAVAPVVAPEAVAAVGAAKAAEPVFSLARDVAAIPIAVGNVLRLPLGVVECVLFPLPGLELGEGLKDLGAGIKAPFQLAFGVVRLPLSAVNAVAGLGKLAGGG